MCVCVCVCVDEGDADRDTDRFIVLAINPLTSGTKVV